MTKLKDLDWNNVADDAEAFMSGWCGEPQDLPCLKEQWAKKEGDLYEEFIEFLISK